MNKKRLSLIKKLIYRSRYRGCKEMDLFLGKFSSIYLPNFTNEELAEYELFLDYNDNDIYDWISGKKEMPNESLTNTAKKILNFNYTDN